MKKMFRRVMAFVFVITLALGGTMSVLAQEERGGNFKVDFDLSEYESEEPVRLWIPYAETDDFQTISNVEVIFDEEYATSEVTEDELGNPILYIEWSPEATERKATYSFDVVRQEVLKPEFKEEEAFDAAEFEAYLQDSRLLVIDGEVKELADSIVEGKETVYEQSQAIYDWIYDNMERNPDVVGCGLGDVDELLTSLSGKCTDIHSVYVALTRAVGIPSREIFGVRLSKDAEADITGHQHCWVEYYQPGTGWVAIDIADVLKAVLTDELDKESPEALELKEYYYGNLDPVRVGFGTGRDIQLVPEQAGEPLNTFGYPYAEVDGEALDFYDPASFVYQITFTELAE